MTEQNELTYKEMSAVADKNGFYLIPMAYYNRMFEEIYLLQQKLKARDKALENKKDDRRKSLEELEAKRKYWENKYKELKEKQR
jgi:PHD/YefM family antitoxin component YafN of YafNO toxin-antitoxin module